MRGASYAAARRCSERRRFLNPCLDVNRHYLYCTGYAAQKHLIDSHAFTAMGNHHHNCLTDPLAQMPAYFQWLHCMVARGLNGWMGRFGSFWDATRSYSACLLGVMGEIEPVDYGDDLFRKMIYCALNPVRAGQVKRVSEWPGVSSAHFKFGEVITAKRPAFFFRKNGDMPDEVQFKLTVPPGFRSFTDAQFNRIFQDALREEEERIHRVRRSEGKYRWVGRETILKQSRRVAPKTPAPRWNLNPHVAAKDPVRRIAMLATLLRFRQDYRAALREWRLAGEDPERTRDDVVFPCGTYQLRAYENVRCRGPD
jgi:hypothetical protein